MYLISSTIDFKDVVLMREAAIGRNPIFHETPHQCRLDIDSRRSPTLTSLGQTCIKVCLISFHGTKNLRVVAKAPRLTFQQYLYQTVAKSPERILDRSGVLVLDRLDVLFSSWVDLLRSLSS